MTSSLSWVRAPALSLIAVWENPPADGIARNNAPATQAMPLAASSWSLSIGGSSRRRTAPATAAVSRKHMMAMAKAPGARAPTLSNDGATGVGSPEGTGAIRAMPCSSIDATLTRMMPRATASSGAGSCGTILLTPRSTASVAAENATVVQLTSPRSSMMPATSAKKLSASGSPAMPSSLGNWPAATVRPTPTLIPISVAWEMLSISAPRRSTRAARRIRPTSSVSIARSPTGSDAVGGDAGGDQRRSGEQRDRRGRAHRHRARTAKQGVDDHRHHARVQPTSTGRSAIVA